MTLVVLKGTSLEQGPPLSERDWEWVAGKASLPPAARADVESVMKIGLWQIVQFPMTCDELFLLHLWIEWLGRDLRLAFGRRAKYGLPSGPTWDQLAVEHRRVGSPSSIHFAVTQLEIFAEHLAARTQMSGEQDELSEHSRMRIGSISPQVRKFLTDPILFAAIWDEQLDPSEQKYWVPAACPREPSEIVAAVLELQTLRDHLAVLATRVARKRGPQRPTQVDLQVRFLDDVMQRFVGRPLKRLDYRTPKRMRIRFAGSDSRKWDTAKRKSFGRKHGDIDWVYRICSECNSGIKKWSVESAMRTLIQRKRARMRLHSQISSRGAGGRRTPQPSDLDCTVWSQFTDGKDHFYIAENSSTK